MILSGRIASAAEITTRSNESIEPKVLFPTLLRPARDVALAMQNSPDINVVCALDVEHQMRIAFQRPQRMPDSFSSCE